ncbi:MAG TPA: Gfo/Idh/MocA family oxidoreductase [Bryobacteraceae bacterium]|nr:Gfo/Idh/MocA family oxidoreductase [Bryobacteraceae bacterium]
MTRRELIGTGAAMLTAASQSRIWGANERLSIALIGCGARGLQLQPYFQRLNGPLTAVCDVWRTRAEKAQSLAPGSQVIDDHRKILDIRGLDAVIVATSDHWHARIAIDALNAGKDVYVEKPLTRTIAEGAAIIDAARTNSRICQVGAQQRSGTHYIQARDEYLKTGELGKINLVRTWWTDGAGGGQANRSVNAAAPTGSHAVPPGMTNKPADLDWNRYLAPVRWRPWDPPQFFNFRNYMDFCGGILTDKYVHWVDVVHMFMGEQVPLTADAAGGIYVAKDGRTVPDTLSVHYEYPGNWICTYTNIGQGGLQREGIEFCGTQGHLLIDRTKYEFFPPDSKAQPRVVECKTDLVEEHVRNFIECVKSRQMPNGDVAVGHRSALAAHLGNLSWMERRRIHFDPDRESALPE